MKDMELLIGRKLAMFPNETRQVVDARFVMTDDSYRIEVMSATLE